MKVIVRAIVAVLIFGVQVSAAPKYDLLLKGGQVIDPRNGVNGARDVAILAGKIAAVAASIDAADAAKTIDARGPSRPAHWRRCR